MYNNEHNWTTATIGEEQGGVYLQVSWVCVESVQNNDAQCCTATFTVLYRNIHSTTPLVVVRLPTNRLFKFETAASSAATRISPASFSLDRCHHECVQCVACIAAGVMLIPCMFYVLLLLPPLSLLLLCFASQSQGVSME